MPRATRPARRVALLVAFVVATVVASCSKETSRHAAMGDSLEHAAPQPSASQAERVAPPEQSSEQGAAPDTAVTDAGIAAILVAANTVDVRNGELAQTTSANDAVKTFAAQVITDHTSVNAKIGELTTRFGLTPKDNATSRRITADGSAARAKLEAAKGAAFDQAYIATEIEQHQQVLDLVDNVLIPRASNADLVALLHAVRPTLAQHLDHARSVQRALERPSAATTP